MLKAGFVLSHKLFRHNDVQIFCDSFKTVEFYRTDISQKVIMHSDNGVQYTSRLEKDTAKK